MNLVRAEVSRLAGRRFVHLMLALLIGAFGVTVATALAASHRPTADELALAEAKAEEARRHAETWREACTVPVDAPEEVRERILSDCGAPEPEDLPVREDFLYGVFIFEREIESLLYFLVAFLALFGLLVGASYIGAELNSGGMTNLLLWRPQRMTVLGTKLGTLLGGVLTLSVVSSALYLGLFWLIAQTRGLPGRLDAEFWGSLALTWSRGIAFALAAAALGFAIATLGRHTAAAVGAVAAYAVVWEIGARIVLEVVGVPQVERWMLSTYVGAWLTGEIRLAGFGSCRGDPLFPCEMTVYTLTWVHALLVLGALGGALLVAAFASFRHRDLA